MFHDFLITGQTSLATRLILFPASFLVHLASVLLLIILPLMNIENEPKIELYNAFLVSRPFPLLPSPLPSLPSEESGKKAGEGGKKKIEPVEIKITPQPGYIFAPNVIPDEIADEELIDFRIGEGVGRGISVGIRGIMMGGIPGGVFEEGLNTPFRTEGQYRPPRLIKSVKPFYPETARQAKVSGIVVLEATTDVYGRVVRVSVLRSIELLDEAAIEAVYQWIYEPMVINGVPRSVMFTVKVNFILEASKK